MPCILEGSQRQDSIYLGSKITYTGKRMASGILENKVIVHRRRNVVIESRKEICTKKESQ
jgi:hypothetical protein